MNATLTGKPRPQSVWKYRAYSDVSFTFLWEWLRKMASEVVSHISVSLLASYKYWLVGEEMDRQQS